MPPNLRRNLVGLRRGASTDFLPALINGIQLTGSVTPTTNAMFVLFNAKSTLEVKGIFGKFLRKEIRSSIVSPVAGTERRNNPVTGIAPHLLLL
eukprot:16431512-Heterocapsa_arctica.AAC.1